MSCLDNIISVGECGSPAGGGTSGLNLFDAPEISIKTLAKMSNENYVSGMALATAKVEQAKKLIKNDIMSAMRMNNAIPNITNVNYTSGTFKTDATYPAEAKERGLTLYRNRKIRGLLRKTTIHTIKIYPLASAEAATLKIYDDWAGGIVSTYSVALVANQVNEFDVEYTIQGSFARVVLDGTDIPVAGSYLTCFTGCNGTMPNDCGYTKGWYGSEISSKEGFGINIDFSCKCDYDELLCGLVPEFIGELLWLKSRVLLLEEHLRSDRLNNWIVYAREETKEFLIDVENQYRTKWEVLMKSLPNLLKAFGDDCIQCNGTKWVVNI